MELKSGTGLLKIEPKKKPVKYSQGGKGRGGWGKAKAKAR